MCLTMNIDIPSIVKHICRKGTFVLFETFDQNLDFGRIGFGNLRAFGHQRLLSPSKIVLQAPLQPYHYYQSSVHGALGSPFPRRAGLVVPSLNVDADREEP